jgi:hypothetical protein
MCALKALGGGEPMQVPVEYRRRWLSELAVALDEARALVLDLGADADEPRLFQQLLDRIEASRMDLRSLRLSRCFADDAGRHAGRCAENISAPTLWATDTARVQNRG